MTPAASQTTAVRIALALLAAAALWLLIAPLYRMGLWLEQPNEGWNATHALNAFGRNLYPPRDGYIINNYPPLWFYLTGVLARLGFDPIFSGRVLAYIAFIATAAAVFLILRRLKVTAGASLAGALCFVVIVAGLLGSYVGLSEPQMLAHALTALGAAVLLRARSAKVAAIAALLTALGILTKQTVIALPLASLVWLVLYRRELLLPWIATGATAGIVALTAFLALYGSDFVANIFFPRVLSLATLSKNLALISKAAVPLVVFALVTLRTSGQRDEAGFFAGLAIAAGVIVILLFGGARGVSINIAFDLVIAASIGLGVAWDRLTFMPGGSVSTWRAAIVAALLLRAGIGVPASDLRLLSDVRERARLDDQSSAILELRDRLRDVRGPVACETLSACVWAGHSNTVDLWKLHFEDTLGSFMDTARLLKRIAGGDYGAIVLFGSANPVVDRQLPGLAEALAAGYGPPQVFGGTTTLFLPKKSR